ncbi:hypothetical protein VTJ49DRAFT_6038 [Mycothermus thermophilus]|uniref:Uncharacterized protein n=1 Tax=Humicola insolens TaxID=85995 RepID=A0ABR3V239_HUMIN
MSTIDELISYGSGEIVLAGLWVVPLSVLWFISLCVARRKRDPARTGIAWLKAAYPFFILSLFLWTIAGGLRLWYWLDDYSWGSSFMENLNRATRHVSGVSSFLRNIGDILLFITFVELAIGFMICLKGNAEQSSAPKTGRIIILVWSFILFVISIAYLGVSQDNTSKTKSSYSSRDPDLPWALQQWVMLNRLYGALLILLWLTSLPMVVLSSVVMHRVRANYQLKRLASLFLVATILNALRLTILTAIDIHYYLTDVEGAVYYGVDVPLAVTFIVQPFFNHVFLFVLLVLLFVLAVRKRNGLWSQPQPEWNYPSVVYVPQQYAVGVVPVQAVPVQQVQPGTQPYPPQQQPPQQAYPQQQQPNTALPAYLQYAQQQQQQQQQQQN